MKKLIRYFKTKVVIGIVLLIAISAMVYAAGSAKGIPFHSVSGGIDTEMVIDHKIRTIAQSYGQAVAEQEITNHYGIYKIGHNENIGLTEEVVWTLSDGHTLLSAAEQLKISSNDANDTAAGTGARTVLIDGINSAGSEISETVTMNGVTAVTTTNSFLRVIRVTVITAGSGLTNAGTISVNDNADVVVLGLVDPGAGQSKMAFWFVPASHEFYMSRFFAGEIAGKKATVRLYAKDLTVTDAAWQLKAEINVNANEADRTFDVPLVFTEKTDIEIRAIASIAGADVIAGFVGVYEQ